MSAWGSTDRPVKLAIGVPVLEKIDPLFWRSFNSLRKPRAAGPLYGETHMFDVIGMLIEDARNSLTAMALRDVPDLTHMLWVDDDMVFNPDALERLITHNLPIVGGLCFNRRPPFQPLMGRRYDGAWAYPKNMYGWCYEYPPDELFRVALTGAGFLLMQREVLDAITAAYGPDEWWSRTEGLTEDFSLMRRAEKLGFSTHVDTGLKIGHRGIVTIDEAFSKRNRDGAWAAWLPAPGTAAPPGAPVATVVITTYNEKPEYLLASILSAVGQTVPVEIIVVDDGSTPPVAENKAACAALEGRGRLLTHPTNKGISAALNTGIRAALDAGADWICWLPSDDLFHPSKVEQQLADLQQHGDSAGYHPYSALPLDGRVRQVTAPVFLTQESQQEILRQVCCINGTTVMLHRAVFEAVGMFDTELKFGQDWDFWIRVGAAYKWRCTPEPLATRREGENLTARLDSATGDNPAALADRIRRDEEDRIIRARYRTP